MMQLRFLTPDDCDILLAWRNDPLTRAMSRTQDPIAPEDHRRWFARAIDDPVKIMMMGLEGRRQIGLIRFDPLDQLWEVGLNLAPAERGKGLGKILLRLGMEHFWQINPAARLCASVRADNLASRKIFETCGFQRIETRAEHDYFEAANPLSALR